MKTKTPITSLLEKKMDRADFLKHVAIGVLAISGVTGVLRAMGVSQPRVGQGYGSSAYGGVKRD